MGEGVRVGGGGIEWGVLKFGEGVPELGGGGDKVRGS